MGPERHPGGERRIVKARVNPKARPGDSVSQLQEDGHEVPRGCPGAHGAGRAPLGGPVEEARGVLTGELRQCGEDRGAAGGRVLAVLGHIDDARLVELFQIGRQTMVKSAGRARMPTVELLSAKQDLQGFSGSDIETLKSYYGINDSGSDGLWLLAVAIHYRNYLEQY